MTIVTHAQFYEDVFLWRFFKDQRTGYYIDVGAAWPDQDSITKCFYDRQWHGINIEPEKSLFSLLFQQRPRDLNLNIAVSNTDEMVTFYFKEDAPGLSTCDESIVKKHLSKYKNPAKTEIIKALSLRTICDRYLPSDQEIDFLKIDVEGFEERVLRGMDFEKYRPKIVVVQSTEPRSQIETWQSWEPILISNDYIFAYFDGLNRFYLAHECSHLKKHFVLPVNVFDRVERSNIISLQNYNSALKDENSVLKLKLDAVYMSKSWRVTLPLRKLGRIFRWAINVHEHYYNEISY